MTGLAQDDLFTARTMDTARQDVTTLMPLWAGIPAMRRAERLVKNEILAEKKFGRTYGLPACSSREQVEDHGDCLVHPLWNWLIGEGLLGYGFRMESAKLFSRVMKAIALSLKKDNAFYSSYHSDTGEPSGDRDRLSGLAPLGWFMDLLGVHILSQFQLLVRAGSPFPWPVTLHFRGLTVVVREKSVLVTFPDGQYTTVTGGEYHLVDAEVIPAARILKTSEKTV